MGGLTDNWTAGDQYEQFMGRWSRRVARQFLEWLSVPPSAHWLEVGCGTGALTQAICQISDPASVVACDPSEAFVSFARRGVVRPMVTFLIAGVDKLPRRNHGFDAVVSGLVLNFLPAPAEAVRAMRTALRPGGTLAAYVWDYGDRMQFLRFFWDAAVGLDPAAAELDEGQRIPLCRPAALRDLFEAEGLRSVELQALEIGTPFPDFNSFWLPFLGSTGPAPSYVASLQPDAQEQLRLRLRERLAPTKDGLILLSARAWAVRGFAVSPIGRPA